MASKTKPPMDIPQPGYTTANTPYRVAIYREGTVGTLGSSPFPPPFCADQPRGGDYSAG